jgi:hypothetical protein
MRMKATLCDELGAWCKSQGMPLMSPEELLLRDLSTDQMQWLSAFLERWTWFMGSEDAKNIPLRTSVELAGMFISVLRETLGAEQFGLCMTGRLEVEDACDGNIVMATAFLRLHGRDTWMPSDKESGVCEDRDLEQDCALWNDAFEVLNKHMVTAR